ncbi:CD3337/EF1877 family mobilome membrane protein [Bacillus pumilus]|uniref:CD3337/EF1877 family mobilome membrane protein n=1 Tax=Bacillus pumilus TaxID=1408 RepID=UPI0011A63639|nr:hypothetical protein [Bacillus pumilus]
MKKNSKIILFTLSVFVIVISFLGTAAFADDNSNKVQPKDVKQGGVTLDSQRYSYDQYEAVADVESSFNPFSEKNINKNLNSIANITFGMTKMIANLVDTGLDWLYNVEVVNKFADKIGDISTALWENLYAAFGVLLFVIAVLYIFFQYVGQKNGMKAGKSTVRLILVIVVAFVWFTQAGWFLKAMNNVSSEVQGLIMKSGTLFNDEQDIAQGEELEGSIALLRNQYFDIAVYKPYLNMNYGMTDENEITKDDKDRITKLIEFKLNKDGYKERKKIAADEANRLGNTMMAQSGIANKIGVAIFSLAFACVLGLPLLLVAFVNFVVQILVLAIGVLLAFSFIISFLPNFSNSGWYTLGRLVGAFLMKAFVGIILLFTFLIINITGELIPMDTPGKYMLNAFVTAVAIILMIKFRDKIIEFVTAGRVVSMDGGTVKQAYDKGIRQPAEKTIGAAKNLAGAAAAAYTGGASAAALQQAKERNENRETAGDVSANAIKSNLNDSPDRSEGRTSQGNSADKVVNMSEFKDGRKDRTSQGELQEDSDRQKQRHSGGTVDERNKQEREPQTQNAAKKAEPLDRERYRTQQVSESSSSENTRPRVTSWDENVRRERKQQPQLSKNQNIQRNETARSVEKTRSTGGNDLSSLSAMEPPVGETEKPNARPNRSQPKDRGERKDERQAQNVSEKHLPENPNRVRGE